ENDEEEEEGEAETGGSRAGIGAAMDGLRQVVGTAARLTPDDVENGVAAAEGSEADNGGGSGAGSGEQRPEGAKPGDPAAVALATNERGGEFYSTGGVWGESLSPLAPR
ncbi:unnamed protein product, partial [Ectocarpus sp. 12 AP-2014]